MPWGGLPPPPPAIQYRQCARRMDAGSVGRHNPGEIGGQGRVTLGVMAAFRRGRFCWLCWGVPPGLPTNLTARNPLALTWPGEWRGEHGPGGDNAGEIGGQSGCVGNCTGICSALGEKRRYFPCFRGVFQSCPLRSACCP